MRMYVVLIFAAILLSFSTAYYAIDLQKRTLAGTSDILEIKKLKKEFEKSKKPVLEIDLSAMYPSRRYAQLLQPSNVFSKEVSSSKTYFSKSCASDIEKMSKVFFDKSETWEDFRCNRIAKLPAKFFENSPLIHESGVSYAFLAYLSGRDPFFTQEWVRSNLNLFHVFELAELPPKSLEVNFRFLASLKKPDLELLLKGADSILSEEGFFIKGQDFNATYKIYTREVLDDFLKEKIYSLKPFHEGKQCFYRDGRFCWEKNAGTLIQIFMQSSIIIFIGSIVVLFLIAIILFRKIKLQNFEEERKKHALRVLTHELRTPIANLMLQVEQINKKSDLLPPHVLEEFLKMEGEVYRLKRLAEKSTSYLQTHDGSSLIAINIQHVDSINELVAGMIDDYLDKGVEFVPSVKDHSFGLDMYWFSICVKNLIENALFHGKTPVRVTLSVVDDTLTLRVIDQGIHTYKNLDELLSSDRTGKNSTGLGLGLSIVQKIMKEMDGKLSFSDNPTTFTLILRNKK